MSKWEKEPEEPYLVKIHESDRIREEGFDSSAPSMHDSDGSSEDTESENEDSNSIPASQEDLVADADGLVPDEMEAGHSPIDDLQGFDWGGVDDELKDFLGSDSENDSDASDASDSSNKSGGSNKSARGEKRKHKEVEDDSDDSDERSVLDRKKEIAKQRSSGLKTVKTPNSMASESSLPTPGGTGDEDGEEGKGGSVATAEDGVSDDGFGDDLEADLLAEFDRDSNAGD